MRPDAPRCGATRRGNAGFFAGLVADGLRDDNPPMPATDAARSPRRFLLGSALIAVGAVVYTSLFWGRFATLWPEPLEQWSTLLYPRIAPLRANQPWVWLTIQVLVGLVVPAGLLRLFGRSPSDLGLGLGNRLGVRWAGVSALAAVPIGAVLVHGAQDQAWTPQFDGRYAVEMLAMIPEHFLIVGVVVAVLLPARRLPRPAPIPRIDRRGWSGFVSWLGFGWPHAHGDARSISSWLGISQHGWCGLLAMCVSATLFATVHIGKENSLELALSFPGGLILAYATLRTGSIWPMIVAHFSMNVLPQAYFLLMR